MSGALRALVIGGTGVIGTGIVEHLLASGADVTSYDRNRRGGPAHAGLKRIVGDRSDVRAFEHAFEKSRFDLVVDLVCFTPRDAESTVRAFGGRCAHVQFCSTVCVYGTEMPPHVLVDEAFPAAPASAYGKAKLACERIFERAAADSRFAITIFRPSHTYGPGGPMLDQLEIDGVAWDRVAKGMPVLCTGDGLGLWQSTHRSDCGKLFAQTSLDPKAFGETYNATSDEIVTWREYYERGARALGTVAQLVFVPAAWLLREASGRFPFLREISQFHGAYSSARARAAAPGFQTGIDFESGARETLADLRARGTWRDAATDPEYQRLVDRALGLGFLPVEA